MFSSSSVNDTLHVVPFYTPPRFSVSTFIYLLCIVLLLSLTAFTLLDCSPIGLGQVIHEHYRKTNFILESNANIHSISHNNLERFKSNEDQHISNDIFENIQNGMFLFCFVFTFVYGII